MGLPELIEIVPFTPDQLQSLSSSPPNLSIPGSKSITNRAIVLAALSSGQTVLKGALWSQDTEAMVECMIKLGIKVTVEPDPQMPANRLVTVTGCGGNIPNTGTAEEPLELFVANAGTAARFLSAMVCLGKGHYRLSGVPRMHQRPQKELFKALRSLGYEVDTPNDMLPAVILGSGPKKASVTVSVNESSQFASALLLSSAAGGWNVSTPEDSNPDELPYVTMTERLVQSFPVGGGTFQIEPDASSASYLHAVNAMFGEHPQLVQLSSCEPPKSKGGSGWQVDAEFPVLMPMAACPSEAEAAKKSKKCTSRKTDLGDSIMTSIAIAALSGSPSAFTDLGVLRHQECERVEALKTELTKCGVQVEETGDTLEVRPAIDRSRLGNATITTYHDHRMAMCLATVALAVPGIKIQDPSCVKKTFPSFFQLLAAPPPNGLGVEIWECDSKTGARVQQLTEPESLLAI